MDNADLTIIAASSITTTTTAVESRSKNAATAANSEAACVAAMKTLEPPHAAGQLTAEVIDLLSSSDEEQEHADAVVATSNTNAAAPPPHSAKQQPMSRATQRTLIRGGNGVSRDVAAAEPPKERYMTHALSIVHDGAAGNENPSQSSSIVVSMPTSSHTADNTASLQGPANSGCTIRNDSTSDQALALAAAAIAKVFQAIRADPPSRPCVAYRDSSSAGSSNGPATASTTTAEPMSTVEAPPTNVLPPEDVELLERLTEQDMDLVPQWNDATAKLSDQSATECLYPVVKGKGRWTSEEDQTLIEKHALYGCKWTEIASHLTGRNGRQCRDRYLFTLNPELNMGKWTDDEEAILIVMHQHHGKRWADISKHLPGRSNRNVKYHWDTIQRKFARDGQAVRIALHLAW
jgi:Myb-like DNA-binding domain